MWNKVKSPVYTILFSIFIVIGNFALERFADISLYYGPFHVLYAAPVIFLIGVIWLIIRLVRK